MQCLQPAQLHHEVWWQGCHGPQAQQVNSLLSVSRSCHFLMASWPLLVISAFAYLDTQSPDKPVHTSASCSHAA